MTILNTSTTFAIALCLTCLLAVPLAAQDEVAADDAAAAVEAAAELAGKKAAEDAGRPAPRVCVALPVAVTDELDKTRERAAHVFSMYGQLVNYRRVLDVEGVEGPADVGIFGTASDVEHQIRAFANAGATDLLAAVFPGSDDAESSMRETRELLKSLISSVGDDNDMGQEARWENKGGRQAGFEEARRQSRPDDIT